MSQDAPAARAALRGLSWAASDSTAGAQLRALVAAAGPALLPPVNTAIASPRGFARSTPTRTLTCLGAGPAAPAQGHHDRAGMPCVALGRLLGSDVVLALRTVAGATLDERSWATPWQVAATVGALCCAGVPVLTAGLSEPVRWMLDPELLAAGDLLDATSVRDPDRREARSIALRRCAHSAYGFAPPPDPAHPSTFVVVQREAFTARLQAELAAQSWPTVRLQVLDGDSGETSLQHDIQAAGSVYLTRLCPGVSYGPHHLQDLVHALRHSGCAVAGSSSRFTHEAEHGAVVERPTAPVEASLPAGQELAGTALWYARDGLSPPKGTTYLNHGCNVVQMSAEPSERASTGIVHRRRPPQLAWFETDHTSAPQAAGSYFAGAVSRARS